MKIIVDVDDTTTASLEEVLRQYNLEWDDGLTPEDTTAWDIRQFVKEACGDNIYSYYSRQSLYNFVMPMPGALEGIETLRKDGHDVLFATANTNPGVLTCLQKHGFLSPDWTAKKDFAVIYRKDMLIGDVIIDDKPENVMTFPGFGILFDRPHNRSFDYPYRAHDWGEAVAYVQEFANSQQNTMAVIPGIGANAPIVENPDGGRQSRLDYRFDLLDPLTMFRIAQIASRGAEKYGEWN